MRHSAGMCIAERRGVRSLVAIVDCVIDHSVNVRMG